MGIQSLKDSKKLRSDGARLGRQGLSERVFTLVDEFNKNRSYKNAMVLAGRLRAIACAAKYDGYWDEKASSGFYSEMNDIESVTTLGTLPSGRESWWIK